MPSASFPDWQSTCPALGPLAEEVATIRAEAAATRGSPGWFSHQRRPDYEHTADWSIFPLYLFDRLNVDNLQAMPRTRALLATIPHLRAALLSRLGPGSVIQPHRGPPEISNFILRCHLGLDVPEHCTLRIRDEERTLAEGEWLIFDDLLEHRSANASDRERVVLICDIARPAPLPLPLQEPPWAERVQAWPSGWEEIGAAGRYLAVEDYPRGLADLPGGR